MKIIHRSYMGCFKAPKPHFPVGSALIIATDGDESKEVFQAIDIMIIRAIL